MVCGYCGCLFYLFHSKYRTAIVDETLTASEKEASGSGESDKSYDSWMDDSE